MVELENKELKVVTQTVFDNVTKNIAIVSIIALTFVLGILSYSSCNQDIVVDTNPPNAENQIRNQPYYMGHKDPEITKLPGETSSSVKYILYYNYSHPYITWGNHLFTGTIVMAKYYKKSNASIKWYNKSLVMFFNRLHHCKLLSNQ